MTIAGQENQFTKKHSRVDKVLEKLRKDDEASFRQSVQYVLSSCVSVLKKSLFAEQWVYLRFVEAELCLRAFTWFSDTLNRHYIANFNRGVWIPYIQLGMRFLSEQTFDLDNMTDEKRALIKKNYGDLRHNAAAQVRSIWGPLSKNHHELASELVRDAVDAGRSSIAAVRDLSVDMFYDMMLSEYKNEKHIQSVEHQCIDEVDFLTTKYGDNESAIEGYRSFFSKRMRAKVQNAEPNFRKACITFLDEVVKLFGLLVKMKSYPDERQYEDERADAMKRLMDYFKDSKKNEMYLRYVYECGLVQQSLKNYTEAGNCFLLYSDNLNWSDSVMKEFKTLREETETKRRVYMYEIAAKMFLLGEAFEKSISVSKKLCDVFENYLFNLSKLADALMKQSNMWRMVANHDRVFLACYLVKFVGNFPPELKNKSFVYRSGYESKMEPIRDFSDRIKKKWPDAKVKNSGNPIPEEFDDPAYEGQYIRITTLQNSSEEELRGNVDKWEEGQGANAPQRLVKYYRNNEINTFFYTYIHKDKKKKDQNEFRSIWVTKTFVQTTPEVVPSLRRRIPIGVETEVIITPLQNAVDSIQNKNKHVRGIITTVENDLQHNTSDLSMNLNGIIDAAVMGGIEKYKEAFFDGTYFMELPNEKKLEAEFKEALKVQLEVVEDGMKLFREHCPENLTPLLEHLNEQFLEMRVDQIKFIEGEMSVEM